MGISQCPFNLFGNLFVLYLGSLKEKINRYNKLVVISNTQRASLTRIFSVYTKVCRSIVCGWGLLVNIVIAIFSKTDTKTGHSTRIRFCWSLCAGSFSFISNTHENQEAITLLPQVGFQKFLQIWILRENSNWRCFSLFKME